MKKILLAFMVLFNTVVFAQTLSIDGNYTISSPGTAWWDCRYIATAGGVYYVSPVIQSSSTYRIRTSPFESWNFSRRSYPQFSPGTWGPDVTVSNSSSAVPHTVGYSYNFDGNDLTEGWRGYRLQNIVADDYSVMEEVTQNALSGQALYTGCSGGYGMMLVSPKITDLATDKKFSVYAMTYDSGSSIQLGTITNPYDPTTFHPLKTAALTGSYAKVDVFFNNYASNDEYIAIKYGGGLSSSALVDDFSYEQSVNCFNITNYGISNISEHSAQINFDAAGEDIWELSVKNLTTNSTQVLTIHESPYTLAQLSGNTSYEIKLRSNCAPGLYSNWTTLSQITTPCDEVLPGYYNSFDDYATYLDRCWSKISGTFDLSLFTEVSNSAQAFSGDKMIKFSGTTTASANTLLISPYIATLDNAKRVRFMLYDEKRGDFAVHSLTVGTMSNPADASTFVGLQTFSAETINPIGIFEFGSLWQQFIVNLNNYNVANNHHYIAFKLNGIYNTSAKVYLDDFHYESLPSCQEPTNLQVTGYEESTATLTWDAVSGSAWEIEYGSVGFASGSGTIVSAANTTTTLSGLTPGTAYDFRIRTVCGSQRSEWSGKGYFKTRCNGITTGYTASFESESFTDNSTCWRRLVPKFRDYYYSPETFLTLYNNASPGNSIPAHTGTHSVRMYGGANSPDTDEQNKIFFVTPKILDFDNTKMISFWLYESSTSTALQQVVVGTLSDPNDYTTFVPFETLTAFTINQWRKYAIDFSGYTGSNSYIAIKAISSNGSHYCYFDDFEYYLNPCKKPTGLTAEQNGPNSASVSWSNNMPGASSWEIEYGEYGFVPGTGTIVSVSSNPFVLGGLQTYKKYQYRVRNLCNTNYVNWSNLYTFRISCQFTAPFYENFDQYNAAANNSSNGISSFCWFTNNTASTFAAGVKTMYLNNVNSAPNSGYVERNTIDGMLISPYMADFGSDKRIKFWVHYPYYYQNVKLVIGTMKNPADPATFEPYQIIPMVDMPASGKEFQVDFSQYTGTNKFFVFKTEGMDYTLYVSNHIYIDNVTYSATPSCYEPLDILFENTNNESVLVKWQNGNSAQNVQIEYGLVGFTPGTGTTVSTSQSEIQVTGLAPATGYDFYFTTFCSSWTSVTVGPKKLYTTCESIALPWTENFNTMTYGSNILPGCFKFRYGNLNAYNQPQSVSGYDFNNLITGFNDTSYLRIWNNFQTVIALPMFSLTAGTTYKLKLKARKSYEYASPNIQVAVGRGQEDHLMSTNLSTVGTLTEYSYQDQYWYYTPLETGDYSYLMQFKYDGSVDMVVDNFTLAEDYPSNVNSNRIYEFSAGISSDLIAERTLTSAIAATNLSGTFALRLRGSETPEFVNAPDVWKANQNKITKVNFKIDGTAFPNLYLRVNLKQTYNTNPQESAFRVMVNGNVVGPIIYPNSSNQDEFVLQQFDLNAYIGQSIHVSLQHLGRAYSGIGDNAYIEYIEVSNAPLAVSEFGFSDFKIYPNPSKDHITLSNTREITKVQLLDIKGQLLFEDAVPQKSVILDVSKYSSGFYFVNVSVGDSRKTYKIIKE